MANVGKESMMGAGDAAKEFLEQEKERLEKRKRNLEVQLKTIIDHRKYSKRRERASRNGSTVVIVIVIFMT